jgi:hypothetical protein
MRRDRSKAPVLGPRKERFVWYSFWSLQALGLLCLGGGESFAITRIGFIARIIAVIVLEPGFIVMQAVADHIFFHIAAVTDTQQFWLGAVSAVAFNAVFLLIILLFIRNIRPSRQN